jgi:hypothetical protein
MTIKNNNLIIKQRKNEQSVIKKMKVDPYIQMTEEEVESFANDTPFLFAEWVTKNGYHKRICMRSDDLEKFRFIRKFMKIKESENKKVIFVETQQLKLL